MDESTQSAVLIVEDNAEITTQITNMLARKGFRAVMAADADEAMNIAEVDRPRLVLTDLDLPTFDLLIEKIRSHETLKDLLVAVIDINEPKLNPNDNVKVLGDFEQLDQLLAL